MNFNKIFRVFVALLMVFCLVINISPVRAHAAAAGSTALVDGLYGIASILIALGVLPGDDQSLFDSLVSDVSSRLSSLGFLYDGFLEVLKIINGTKVNYYVAENVITEVRNYLVEFAVISRDVRQPVCSWDVWSSSVPFKPVHFFLVNDSGEIRRFTACCSSSPCVLTRDDGYTTNLSSFYSGYYWGNLASGEVSEVKTNLKWATWGQYIGTYNVGSSSTNLGWNALNYVSVPFEESVDSSFTAGYVPSTSVSVSSAYVDWAEGSITDPEDEEENKIYLPVGVGSTYEETISQTQSQVQTGESTYVETETDSTTSSISQSWLGQKLDSIVSSVSGFFSDVISAVQAIPGAFSTWFQDVISGLQSIPDSIAGVLSDAFAVSDTFVSSKVEALTAKYPYLDTFRGLGLDLKEFFSNLGVKPPIIYIHLDSATGSIYWGGSQPFLDLSWYSDYKDTMDNILGGFIWLWLGWRTYLSLPGIISGASGVWGAYQRASEVNTKSRGEDDV